MDNSNKVIAVLNHLQQEINWVESLNELLSTERDTLLTRKFDELEILADKKQELSNKLESSAKQRLDLISDSPTEKATSLSASEFLKKCTPEETIKINQLNAKLAEKLSQCRELNMVNGQVIANNLHTRQEIVNALSGNEAESGNVYNSSGNMSAANNNNRHQEA